MPVYLNLSPEEIQTSHFNPTKRVERNGLTGLLLSVREHGIISPLALTASRILADGHRRLAVAKLLKLPTVPVAIYSESSLTAPELWVLLNSDTMSLTPAQWLAAVESGLPLETPGFPERLRARIGRLIQLVGREEVSKLVAEGRSPMILDVAERVARYLDHNNDETFLRQILLWLIHTGNAWAIKSALEDKIPGDLLIDAIQQNRDIGRVWDLVL